MTEKHLPKIVFIGAVTFEETTGSHLLFYRLFKDYPPEKLMIIGSHKFRNPTFPPSRLPKVIYHLIEDIVPNDRLKDDQIFLEIKQIVI